MTIREQIENNFTYHEPTIYQIENIKEIRFKAKDLALQINVSCPDSREKAVALTKLEEMVMWANAAIVRNKFPKV